MTYETCGWKTRKNSPPLSRDFSCNLFPRFFLIRVESGGGSGRRRVAMEIDAGRLSNARNPSGVVLEGEGSEDCQRNHGSSRILGGIP
jgi:hypothetical protein